MAELPGLKTPVRRGNPLLGIMGAFTGAVIGAAFWILLMVSVPSGWRRLVFLTGFLVGPMSCLGYRLFRGLRSTRFARNTVRVCMVLSPLPGMLAPAVIACWWVGLPADRVVKVLQETLVAYSGREVLFVLAGCSLFFLLSARFGYSFLLAYTDPAWYSDPRRLARIGGGGAAFNLLPGWPLPPAAYIPECFTVDKQVTVVGDTITVRKSGNSPCSFSVGDVAGVVLGVPTGYNILYDKNNVMLAKFAWSRNNALLLGQYLLQREVPFVDLNGEPVPTHVEERTVPHRFTVREGKPCLILGCVCVLLFGGAAVACVLVWEDVGILLLLVDTLLFFLLGIWPLLSYRNRRLEVDGEQLTYTTPFRRTTRFQLDDITDVTRGVEIFKLKNREGRVLARFERNMENAHLLSIYLDQHTRQESKERNGLHEQSHRHH